MRSWVIAGAVLTVLTGRALAQTAGTFIDPESNPLLPPILNLTQNGLTSTQTTAASSVLGLDLGHGFKTEIEGVTARTRGELFGNLPQGGNIAGSSIMLNGLYEFSDGGWRMKPYVGAGFGVLDSNARILGATTTDWVSGYQLHGGVSLGFTQKLIGSLEYRWTMGSKPRFMLGGIPTKVEVDRHGFVIGVNYKY